jgi:hypothetical protein
LNRWEIFVTLCGHLREGLLDGAPHVARGNVPWEKLIEVSSHHYVTPTLAWCLRDRTDLPPEIRDYFAAALTLNGRRNKRLIGAVARIAAALNTVDIEPALLKGAARLVDEVYPSAKLRFLGDIDVLIPADRSADAVSALQRAGFEMGDDPRLGRPHHHLPMMNERETGAGVELHTALASPPNEAIVRADWFLESTRPFQLQGFHVRLPDATRAIAHNVVHDQLNSQGHNRRLGRASLRQLLDLTMLRARYEEAIDWNELDHRFCSAGSGTVLATYLEFGRALLGQPAPNLTHAPRKRALATFRRNVNWPVLSELQIPVDNVLTQPGGPAGLLRKLVRPQTWSTGIRLIKASIDNPKW